MEALIAAILAIGITQEPHFNSLETNAMKTLGTTQHYEHERILPDGCLRLTFVTIQ